jgi:hypothetical protein
MQYKFLLYKEFQNAFFITRKLGLGRATAQGT